MANIYDDLARKIGGLDAELSARLRPPQRRRTSFLDSYQAPEEEAPEPVKLSGFMDSITAGAQKPQAAPPPPAGLPPPTWEQDVLPLAEEGKRRQAQIIARRTVGTGPPVTPPSSREEWLAQEAAELARLNAMRGNADPRFAGLTENIPLQTLYQLTSEPVVQAMRLGTEQLLSPLIGEGPTMQAERMSGEALKKAQGGPGVASKRLSDPAYPFLSQLIQDIGLDPLNLVPGVGVVPAGELGAAARTLGREAAAGAKAYGRSAVKTTGPVLGIPKQELRTAAAGAKVPKKPVDLPKLPRELAGAKPRYNIGQKAFEPEFASDVDKALFIIAQAKPSRADTAYMGWLKSQFPESSEGTLRGLGIKVRQSIKSLATGSEEGLLRVPDTGIRPAQTKPPAPSVAPAAPVPAKRATLDFPMQRGGTLHTVKVPGQVVGDRFFVSRAPDDILLGRTEHSFAVSDLATKERVSGPFDTSAQAMADAKQRLTQPTGAAPAQGVTEPEIDPAFKKQFDTEYREAIRRGIQEQTEQRFRNAEEAMAKLSSPAPQGVTEAVTPPPALAPQAPPELLKAGGASIPPVEPPKAPAVTSGAMPEAKGPAPGVAAALQRASAVVQRDKPGLTTQILDLTPGIKSVQRELHPSLGMKEEMLKGYIGQGSVRATASNTLQAEVMPKLAALEDVFGKDTLSGNVKITAPFIGADTQKVPFTGTLMDAMQRPALYDLSAEQRALLSEIQATKSANLQSYRDLYDFKIGEYPTPEGSVHLPNVDRSESGLAMAGGTETGALRKGRAKTRFYETAADRWIHDQELVKAGTLAPEKAFDPVLDVSKLMHADNENLAAMSANEVFKAGVGGKTKLELIKETHPGLYNKMTALRKRLQSLRGTAGRLSDEQQSAIDDFLNGGYSDDELSMLQADLMPTITKGKNAGKDLAVVNKEIAGVKAQISALRPAWETANPRGYVFIQDGGIYRYVTAEDAEHVKRLTTISNSSLLRFVDDLRATAFGGDLSPGTIQATVAWLADPYGVTKSLANEAGQAVGSRQLLRPFSVDALAEDIRVNAATWKRFTDFTGMNPLGFAQREEFGPGFLAKIPKVGKYWTDFNDAVYRPLMKISKDSFDNIYEAGLKNGLSPDQAAAVAGDDVTKLIPAYNYRRLGLSQAESARYRALLTSVSFLTQPASLVNDATKGLLKLGTFGKISKVTPTEAFAMKRVLTLAAMVSAVSAVTGVLYAEKKGKDTTKAALAAITPGDPYFWSLVLPNGSRIGLGGPFRSLLRAIAPGEVRGVPFPMPFARLDKFALSKMNPALKVVYDETRNKDYYGKQIRNGEFPMNVFQGLEYAGEGALPLTLGTAAQDIRRGKTENIVPDVLSQLAGVNMAPEDTVYNATRAWKKELDQYNAIPSNSREANAKGLPSRNAYRQKNAEIDAKLLITGQTSSLQSSAAREVAAQLMRENNIRVADLPKLAPEPYESREKKELREWLQRRLGELGPVEPVDLGKVKAAEGEPEKEPTPLPVPYVRYDWDTFRKAAGSKALLALHRVWYEDGQLTPDEERALRSLFNTYSLGQTNFKTWYKQALRQLYEKTQAPVGAR